MGKKEEEEEEGHKIVFHVPEHKKTKTDVFAWIFRKLMQLVQEENEFKGSLKVGEALDLITPTEAAKIIGVAQTKAVYVRVRKVNQFLKEKGLELIHPITIGKQVFFQGSQIRALAKMEEMQASIGSKVFSSVE